LPWLFVSEDGVEDDEEFSGDGDEGEGVLGCRVSSFPLFALRPSAGMMGEGDLWCFGG